MNYELSFLTPNLKSEEKEALLSWTEKQIQEMGGTIQETFNEKKKFAYPVKRQKEGFLVIFSFSLEPNNIGKLKRKLQTNKNILREIIEKREVVEKVKRYKEKPIIETKYKTTKTVPKKKKVKIEELDKKLEEILK